MPNPVDELRRLLLEQRLQKFAPADVSPAVELLADPDPRLQRLVGDALIRTGRDAIAPVAGLFEHPTPASRRAAAYILGELLRRAPEPTAARALRSALSDEDAKVRKNAAIALGKIAATDAVEDLARQLRVEDINYVRPSIVLALGEIGGAAAHAALGDFTPLTADDERALQLALERSGDQQLAAIRTDLPINATLDLLCRSGTESLLGRELEQGDQRYERKGAGYVRLRWRSSLDELFRFRCFDTLAFPIMDLPQQPLARPAAVADAFTNAPAFELVRQLTRRDASPEIRYRVTFELDPPTAINRREWIGTFRSQLEQRGREFLNSPGRYSWELLVRRQHKQWYLALRPTAYQDPRFAYRVADVPAALNPSVAAAMTRVLPCNGTDIVVDPFCGSGTPLVERALYAPYQLLIGIDHDTTALAAAQQNIAAAGVQHTQLLEGDAYQLESVLRRRAITRVDAMITNPPYGVRVGSPDQIKRLYPAFMRAASSILRAGSHVVMLAKDGKTARAAAQQHGFGVEQELRIDTGGILVYLFDFRRR